MKVWPASLPETMGRASVIGSLDEIILLVSQEPSFLPCVDFAHLHAVDRVRWTAGGV